MKKSNLRAAAALQALALMGAGVATAFIAAAPAQAQDYTSGSITGTVTDASGNPVSGAVVTLTSEAQGFTQTSTTSASGNFQFSNLTSGGYDVSVQAAGNAGFRADSVTVLAGQTADLNIALSGGDEEIVVMGSRIQAFTGTTTGLNVDVEEITKIVPLGRNLTSVILLAPSTSRGDSAFGNLASVGGSSVAENAYYVNGLNTTNFDNYLGSAQVPFEFYKSVEVKAGGYPAEFGRATGGIVNAVTKTGSNDYTAAVHLGFSPNSLRSRSPDLLNCENVSADQLVLDLNCTELTNRHADYSKSWSATVEAGGPVIRDRLFVYGMVEFKDTRYSTTNVAAGTQYQYRNNDPFWGVKVDAYPIDDHHLEFTLFDTRNTLERGDATYSQNAQGDFTVTQPEAVTGFKGGGVNYVGKYTGRFTDFLTVSGAYGKMRDRFDFGSIVGPGGVPFVRNDSGTTIDGVPDGGYFTSQRVGSTQFPYTTERKFYRGDVDVYASLFGDHHFRAGFDVEKNRLQQATSYNGGEFLFGNGYITSDAFNVGLGNAGVIYLVQPNDAAGNPQVDVVLFNSGGTFDAKNEAWYIQDEWKVTDRLTASLGLRRDDFMVESGSGEPLVTLDKNYAPRIGLTYDMWGDKRGKLKAFYGVYYLPFASNTSARNTGSEYYFTQRFTYTGFDANGIPNLDAPVVGDPEFADNCPFEIVPGQGPSGCFVTDDGEPADAESYIAKNLAATKEAEWIVGYEHKLGRWNLGINYIHRSLKRTAEDVAIDAAVNAYCADNGINCNRPDGSLIFNGYRQYVIINPGADVDVLIHGCRTGFCTPLEGTVVTLSADDLGYPKAKRTYDAVELTFDRPYDGVWSFGGSYTWSKSKGNTEGFVQSDYGQDDAGITVDFDQPGFTDNSYGYLPNDRRHRFKLYGAYTFADKLTLGGNYSLESPRSLSCFGFHPTDVFANGYGAYSHFCGGQDAPRGTGKKTDWISTLDVKAAYRMKLPTGSMLNLRVDVFNLFNSAGVDRRNEFGDLDNPTDASGNYTYVPDPSYGQIAGYQAARVVRLGVDIEF